MRLAEIIGRWLGRVEVVLAGADEALRQGEQALGNGNPMLARAEARAVLQRVPGSPLALALLADACEAAGLHAELTMTLEELATRVGSRAEVWLRLGKARQLTGAPADDVRDALVRAVGVAEAGSEARREALVALTDVDLEAGDGARADLWLDRLAHDETHEVATRRAEARLARGDATGALQWVERMGEPSPIDGRDAMTRGRAWAMAGDARALAFLTRALMLDVPGASEQLSSVLAHSPTDEPTRARVRAVVEARGEGQSARWRAAFARAEGRREEARRALLDAVKGGDQGAASALTDAALDDQDHEALRLALAELPADLRRSPRGRDAAKIPDASSLADPSRAGAHFDSLATVTDDRVRPWAESARQAAASALVPSGSPAAWGHLLPRLDQLARELHDLGASLALANLSADRARPVRVAVIGEFNAGKSTFINAFIGADVAPTGVLPTTATLHHLRYAADPIARVAVRRAEGGPPGDQERIVPLPSLRATLSSYGPGEVRRVEILLPLASLTRVEVIDTPGFNAPDTRHARAAREAFEEADAVIWLADAAQPMKKTERDVLEEVLRARIPIQVLVNKADRLAPADLARVMGLVREGLEAVGVASWSPPLAFSARLALKGRLGDPAALEASGWSAIEALLDTQLVGKSDVLKERALRRRAASVVSGLGRAAALAARREDESVAAASRTAEDASQAAARIDRDPEAAAGQVLSAIEATGGAWQREIDVVVTGRDTKATASDPTFLRYRIDRATALLSPPLASAMASLAACSSVSSEDVAPTARALVRAFVARPGSASMALLARAAVDTVVDHLGRFAVTARPPQVAAGRVRELVALAAALQRE